MRFHIFPLAVAHQTQHGLCARVSVARSYRARKGAASRYRSSLDLPRRTGRKCCRRHGSEQLIYAATIESGPLYRIAHVA